jgi:hypothetical protein
MGGVSQGTAAAAAAAAARGVPVFFFSYARKDRNKLMERFFAELLDQVGRRGPFDESVVCFHDLTSLGAGELWEQHILQALRNSAVFLAMYTPWYFEHVRGKRCFCGREFAAFRSRSDSGTQTNIVAVKWTVPSHDRNNFPPPCVEGLSRALGKQTMALLPEYEELGLDRVWTRFPRRRQYVSDAIVDQILELARTPPAELPDLPDMDAVPCAFHNENVEAADFPAATASAVSTGGPTRTVLVYADPESAVPDDGAFQVQQTAFSMRLDPQCLKWTVSATGADGVLPTLRASSNANNTTILVVRSELLRDQGMRAEITRVAADSSWCGGVLLLGQPPHDLSGSAALVGTALGPANVRDQIGLLGTGVGKRLRQVGAPQRHTPDGTTLPSL